MSDIGPLAGDDLYDWRELQAEFDAAREWPGDWSQAEKKALSLRSLVMQWRFYERHNLDHSMKYEFDPVTGAITEAVPEFEVKAGIIWEDEDA